MGATRPEKNNPRKSVDVETPERSRFITQEGIISAKALRIILLLGARK
jgi:hypothetical protein